MMVIEALFPWVPVTKRTAAEEAEIERWLAAVKEEALKIDPDTAEVRRSYTRSFDPYNVLDEWELPQELQEASCYGWMSFARAPGSDIWVESGDLPEETQDRLYKRHNSERGFPPGLEGRGTLSHPPDEIADDIPF